MIGSPVFEFPMTTIFVLVLAASFSVRLDALPLQQLRADSLRDDALEVSDALRLDPLALGLLLFLLEHELHRLGFLLAPELS